MGRQGIAGEVLGMIKEDNLVDPLAFQQVDLFQNLIHRRDIGLVVRRIAPADKVNPGIVVAGIPR